MNFEHVYASAVMAIVMFFVCEVCLYVAIRADDFSLPNGWVGGKKYILCAMLSCILAEDVCQSMALGVIVGGLLFACITDSVQCQVYHFVWWIIGGVLLLWIIYTVWNCASVPWLEMIAFCLIQEFLFAKLYGKADCHAFGACAIVLALRGQGMICYLLQMTISLFLLGYVQWTKKNISHKGNLIKPVPFMPYIIMSFVVIYMLIA